MHHDQSGDRHGRPLLAVAIASKIALAAVAIGALGYAGLWPTLGAPLFAAHAVVVALAAGALLWWFAQGRAAQHQRQQLTDSGDRPRAPHIGILLHSAGAYDLMEQVVTFGRQRAFRQRMLSFAELAPGEAVLDVGCGTGSIALLARRQVGLTGRVDGIDPSNEMIARAKSKAARAGLAIGFATATAQHLPFEAGSFDAVVSTLMMHHLPKRGREAFVIEGARVLKPDGRMLVVDWSKPPRRRRLFRLHRHGHVDMHVIAGLLEKQGFAVSATGDVGMKKLRYLVARRVAG